MIPEQLYQLGIAIIPLWYRRKTPRIGEWKQYQTELPTWADLKRWGLGSPRPSNWAAICGWNGLTVLDFDELTAWEAYQEWARGSQWGTYALSSYRVKTRRGIHLYLFVLDTPDKHCIDWNGRIDIQGRGAYVLIPPSVHPSGAQYWGAGGPIATVRCLADVLPEDARRHEAEPGPEPGPAVPAPAPALDLFDRAMTANAPMPRDAAARIRDYYRIEALFPDVEPSGGPWFKVNCPYHDDEVKSGWVNVDQQTFGCHACRFARPKDVINVYAQINGLTNSEAMRVLLEGMQSILT